MSNSGKGSGSTKVSYNAMSNYGVPEGLAFQTEPELGLAMVQGIAKREALPFQWVAADEHFGMNPDFLDGIAALGRWYFAEAPANTMVWEGQPTLLPPGPVPLGRPREGAGSP